MKQFALSCFLLITAFCNAQTVKNLRHEIKADKVMIYYQLPDFNERFVFNVSVLCSIDGGERFELENVQGDMGNNIRANLETYKVIWDYKKEVNQLINPEFWVSLELVRLDPPEGISRLEPKEKIRTPEQRSWYIGYNGSFGYENQSLGWRIANMGKVGGFLAFSVDPQDTGVGTITGGPMIRLTPKQTYQIHYYFGTGIGDYFDEITFESGIIQNFGNLSLALGMNFETGVDETNFVFGFGVKFK